jgi:AraC-like DNA-binding protein
MKRLHKRATRPIEAQYEYICAHFREEVSVAALARRAGYSTAQFIERFRRFYGATPKKYVTLLRLNRARLLLSVSTLSACEIAAHCGYEDTYHFYKLFRRRFGETPTAYRQRIRRGETRDVLDDSQANADDVCLYSRGLRAS